MRAAMARAARRIMLAFGVVTAGSLLVLTLLITAFIVHAGGGLHSADEPDGSETAGPAAGPHGGRLRA
jgi:hypothetical protein